MRGVCPLSCPKKEGYNGSFDEISRIHWSKHRQVLDLDATAELPRQFMLESLDDCNQTKIKWIQRPSRKLPRSWSCPGETIEGSASRGTTMNPRQYTCGIPIRPSRLTPQV